MDLILKTTPAVPIGQSNGGSGRWRYVRRPEAEGKIIGPGVNFTIPQRVSYRIFLIL
jgi:hypothetical protein